MAGYAFPGSAVLHHAVRVPRSTTLRWCSHALVPAAALLLLLVLLPVQTPQYPQLRGVGLFVATF